MSEKDYQIHTATNVQAGSPAVQMWTDHLLVEYCTPHWNFPGGLVGIQCVGHNSKTFHHVEKDEFAGLSIRNVASGNTSAKVSGKSIGKFDVDKNLLSRMINNLKYHISDQSFKHTQNFLMEHCEWYNPKTI